MFIPNIGATAGLLLGGAVAVAAAPVQAAENYVLGMCNVAQPGSGAEIRPTYEGDTYLFDYQRDLYNKLSSEKKFTFDDNSVKITLVKAPAHGSVEHVDTWTTNNWYHYYPTEGYSGEDRFVMQVEKNGVKVRIQYLMKVLAPGESPDYLCSPEQIWKISSSTIDANGNQVLTLLAQPASTAHDTTPNISSLDSLPPLNPTLPSILAKALAGTLGASTSGVTFVHRSSLEKAL